MHSDPDLMWAAGFYEGEGSISWPTVAWTFGMTPSESDLEVAT